MSVNNRINIAHHLWWSILYLFVGSYLMLFAIVDFITATKHHYFFMDHGPFTGLAFSGGIVLLWLFYVKELKKNVK